MTSVYGVPLKHALHFFKVLAAKGRQLASMLVNTYGIMSQILTYVSLEPSEVSMPLQEVLMLSQEAYGLWSIFLAYGLTKAQEAFSSFYPMLVKQLVFYREKVPVNENVEKNKFNYDVGSHMLAVISRALNIAASHSLLKNKMMLNQGTLIDSEGKAIVLPPPLLTWEDMNDFPSLVETCLHKWLTQLMRSSEVTFSALRLVGSCCNFLECYYSKWRDQVSYNSDACNGKILHISDNILSPFLESVTFKTLLKELVLHSALISDLPPGTKRDPVNLGSLGCVTFGGKVIPILQPLSPFPLLLPLVSLCLTLHSLHPVLDVKTVSTLLESEEIGFYLGKFCQSPHSLRGQWLTRIDTHILFNLLKLAALKGCTKIQLYHKTAMCLMPCIHKGDEVLVKELINFVICTKEFTQDITDVNARVDHINLNDYVPLNSPALVQPVLSPMELTKNIYQSITSIGSELVNCLLSKKEYESSTVLKNGIPFITNGITISQTESSLALERCWTLVPIKHAYGQSRQRTSDSKEKAQANSSDQSNPEDILTVNKCLQMTYLGLKYRRNCLLKDVSVFAWLQQLSLVFLVANDTFLDANVSSYLQGCVVELLRNKGYANLQTTNHLEGFNSCLAWFKELLEQFISVSYGDSTFALFLLIPLQQYWPSEFRLQIWGDMLDALPYIMLSEEQVTQFIPIEQFCEPAEEDERLIIKYRSSLGSQMISERKNSFLYKLASHHIKEYFQRIRQRSNT
ncbi:hypothetical protein SK128_015476 [Halocaridina rubra]|uniref:RPAP1/MINIYO-like TPR repeats domain-containing protein n=1 Tax=Halocaridina rubra TaxID=373956 RepID=A0AAN8XMI7_HALRR